MNHIEKIEDEVMKYFNDICGGTYKLRVLDGAYKKSYSGVTLHYIYKYVLKKKFSKSNVASVLMKLLTSKKIKCLHCPDVNKMVFNNIECPFWSFDVQGYKFVKPNSGYTYILKALEYSKNYIKYLEDSYSNKFQSVAEMTTP